MTKKRGDDFEVFGIIRTTCQTRRDRSSEFEISHARQGSGLCSASAAQTTPPRLRVMPAGGLDAAWEDVNDSGSETSRAKHPTPNSRCGRENASAEGVSFEDNEEAVHRQDREARSRPLRTRRELQNVRNMILKGFPAVEQNRHRTVVDKFQLQSFCGKLPVQIARQLPAALDKNNRTSGSAISGAAASLHEGRRPRRTSPYNVNCETNSNPPSISLTETFIFPSGSSKMRSAMILGTR